MTSEADRTRLLRIAHDALAERVAGRERAPLPDAARRSPGSPTPPEHPWDPGDPADPLSRRAGAFVTLTHGGELRGCIGHIEGDRPVARVVADCAAAAGTADPRFPPVSREELPAIAIEISVLEPFERVSAFDDIEVGRHGLMVEQGRQRGLLLPQVAVEWAWDRETFLAQICRKAGLPPDAWRNGATIWRFEAEVFGDRAAEG